MLVQLTNRPQVVSYSIFYVPLIIFDTRALSAMIECHIVQSLSHGIVLVFDWLCTCNPHIDWQVSTLLVQIPIGITYWLFYLVIPLGILSLLLWTQFSRRLTVEHQLGLHLSPQLSLMMPWGHMVLLPVESLGMLRLTIGMICVLSLLKCSNYCQCYKSVKLSIGSNYCQVIPLQVNNNIGYHHQS